MDPETPIDYNNLMATVDQTIIETEVETGDTGLYHLLCMHHSLFRAIFGPAEVGDVFTAVGGFLFAFGTAAFAMADKSMSFIVALFILSTIWVILQALSKRLIFSRFFSGPSRFDVVFTGIALLVLLFTAIAGWVHVFTSSTSSGSAFILSILVFIIPIFVEVGVVQYKYGSGRGALRSSDGEGFDEDYRIAQL